MIIWSIAGVLLAEPICLLRGSGSVPQGSLQLPAYYSRCPLGNNDYERTGDGSCNQNRRGGNNLNWITNVPPSSEGVYGFDHRVR
jgi:hypothetical protein